MKSDKKPVIGLICVMVCCIFVLCITIGLFASVGYASFVADSEASESEPGLEWGYKFKHVDIIFDGGWVGDIAYKSPKSTFNVDEVTLTVSFGSLWAKYGPEDCDVPEYDIYFKEHSEYVDESIYTLKTVRKQFFSEEYCINRVVDGGEDWDYHYEFNHTEQITIPKELFTESEGIICLMIGGTKIGGNMSYQNGYMILAGTDIKYQLKGTEVILSKPYNYSWYY